MGLPKEQKRRTNQRAPMRYRPKTFRRLSQWWKNLQELKSARVRENSSTSRRVRFVVYIVVESWPKSFNTREFSYREKDPRYLESPFHIQEIWLHGRVFGCNMQVMETLRRWFAKIGDGLIYRPIGQSSLLRSLGRFGSPILISKKLFSSVAPYFMSCQDGRRVVELS